MLLKDKVAIIHGAGGAIGGATARAFAGEGARVFLAGRSRQRLDAVADAIGAAGGTTEVAVVDALDEAAVERHADDVHAAAGRIDVALNAVGLVHVQGPGVLELSLHDFLQPVEPTRARTSSPRARRHATWSRRARAWSSRCPRRARR